jgi:hypothetical protein
VPYLKELRKQLVKAKRQQANEDGDWNYLYSVEYLEAFIANPCYATIARIGKSAIEPHKLPGVEALDEFLTFNGVSLLDRREAREEALAEFRRRIVAYYEDKCIERNGDLDEYKRALKVINDKFATVEAK